MNAFVDTVEDIVVQKMSDFGSDLVLRLSSLQDSVNQMVVEIKHLKSENQMLRDENLEVESLKIENQSLSLDKDMMSKEIREMRGENDLLIRKNHQLAQELREGHTVAAKAIEIANSLMQTKSSNGIVSSLPTFSNITVLTDRPSNSLTTFGSSAISGMRLNLNESNEDNTYHSTGMPLNSIENSKEMTSSDTYYDAKTSNQSSLTNGSSGFAVRPQDCQQNQVLSTIAPTAPMVSSVVDPLNHSLVSCSDGSSNSHGLDENNNLRLNLAKVPIGRAISVNIAFVESPSNFWLHINPLEVNNYLHVIQVKQEELRQKASPRLSSADITLGMYCAALYTKDGYWYRAQVIRINYENRVERDSIKTVVVLYIDWGNTEELPLQKIMRLSMELTKRRQAIQCYLQGFSLGNYKWSEKCIKDFNDLIKDKALSASFQKCHQLDEQLNKVIYPTDLIIIFEDGTTTNLIHFLPIPEIIPDLENGNEIESNEPSNPSPVTSATLVCKDRLNGFSNKSLEMNGNTNSKVNSPELRAHSNQNCATNGIECNGSSNVSSNSPKSMPQLNIVSEQMKIPAPIVPDSDEGLIVDPSYVSNPSNFYLQINDPRVGTAHLEDLSEQLNQYYSKLSPTHVTIASEVTIGSFWSCLYSEDNCWYRIRVVQVRKIDALVNYVDYGNEEYVVFKRLMPLTRKFATYPAMAVHCSLANVLPKRDNNWSEKSNHFFADLIRDKPLTAFVAKRCFKALVANGSQKYSFDSTLEVFLWTNESKEPTSEDVLINLSLVLNNCAITDNNDWLKEAERAHRSNTPPKDYIPQVISNRLNSHYSAVNGHSSVSTANSAHSADAHNIDKPSGASNKSCNFGKVMPELAEDYSDDEDWDPIRDDFNNYEINNYNAVPDNPICNIIRPVKTTRNNIMCKYYARAGGCRLGEYCSFLHISPDSAVEFDDRTDEPLDIPDLELKVDSYVWFKITSILSPFSFYGVLPFGTKSVNQSLVSEDFQNEYEDLHRISATLKDKCLNPSVKESPDVFPGIGSLVAYRETDGTYYRGRIIREDTDEDLCSIFNIDMGFNVDVKRSTVFQLDPYFCHFPALAVHCSLVGIEPMNCSAGRSVWSEQSIDAFGDWTLDKVMCAHIMYGTDDKIYVELMDREGENDVLISEKLVQLKFAQRLSNSSEPRVLDEEDIYDSDLD